MSVNIFQPLIVILCFIIGDVHQLLLSYPFKSLREKYDHKQCYSLVRSVRLFVRQAKMTLL